MSWGRETGVRPSGKAFSMRLSDGERERLQAAVDKLNGGKGDYEKKRYGETLGSFVKSAALASAERILSSAAVRSDRSPASGTTALESGHTARPLGGTRGSPKRRHR